MIILLLSATQLGLTVISIVVMLFYSMHRTMGCLLVYMDTPTIGHHGLIFIFDIYMHVLKIYSISYFTSGALRGGLSQPAWWVDGKRGGETDDIISY